MSVKRFFAFADRYFLRRALPHGIINWRYVLPYPPPKVRIHRRLWLLGRPSRLPFALFLVIEFILWLRWVIFAAWWRSWRIAQRRGAIVSEREGIGKTTLLRRVLFLSLGHCIPPAEMYAFGLYREESRQAVWDFVFTHELPAFHIWRSPPQGPNRQSMSVLQDKHGLTELLAPQGFPMAPVLGLISHGASFDPAPWVQQCSRLFCKPRHGSASRDTFVVEARPSGEKAAVFTIANGMKAQAATAKELQKAMAKDDFLVQPFLDNHPALAALTPVPDAVTLRVITQTDPLQGAMCYCATLEIPHVSDTDGSFHIILPIDTSSGMVEHFPDHRLPSLIQARYDEVYTRMGVFIVPHWEEIRKSALAAHRYFPDVYAIAWDYVVTPDGPYMLEGNTGWGTSTPQVLHGGLLHNVSSEEQ
jgi:hypothetical protein